jgi:hypothetical protein
MATDLAIGSGQAPHSRTQGCAVVYSVAQLESAERFTLSWASNQEVFQSRAV